MSISPSMKESHENPTTNDSGESPGSPSATQVAGRENRPSPSLHEEVIARHHGRDPRTNETIYDPLVSRMTNAVGTARLAAERAGRVSQAIFANEMMTLPARHREVKAKCWKITQPVLADIDSALAACRREIESLEQKTSAPIKPTDAAGYFLASEVRQRLASLSDADREAALGTALAEEDDAFLGAVLAGSPMLSGISKARQQLLRSAWQKARFGPELERLTRLKAALDDTERAGTLALSYTISLSSEEIVARAEASERAVRDALES